MHCHRQVGIALSGGADSLGLLALAKRWADAHHLDLYALIVDHRLRHGSASEASNVKALAIDFGVKAEILSWHRPCSIALHGKQRAARWARYALLADAAHRLGLNRVWVGHTREDQAETLWMRWLSGSGLWGLGGFNVKYCLFGTLFERPVLGMSHKQLRRIAVATFGASAIIDDPTNQDPTTWRGSYRALYGRGLYRHAMTGDLVRLSDCVAQWRASVERDTLALSQQSLPLRQTTLNNQPFACAAWLSVEAQKLTQREFPLGFDRALSFVRRLGDDTKAGVRRGRRTIGGVLLKPCRDSLGAKAWQLTCENDPRQAVNGAEYQGGFWRRLFENSASLQIDPAFSAQQPVFTIATDSFTTTLKAIVEP